MKAMRPTSTERAARAVCGTLARHVSPGETAKLLQVLPEEIRSLLRAN